MILTRQELSELLGVQEKYLCASNFTHIKGGAAESGYNLISMEGRGKKAIYEIEPINLDLPNEIWKPYPDAPNY